LLIAEGIEIVFSLIFAQRFAMKHLSS